MRRFAHAVMTAVTSLPLALNVNSLPASSNELCTNWTSAFCTCAPPCKKNGNNTCRLCEHAGHVVFSNNRANASAVVALLLLLLCTRPG